MAAELLIEKVQMHQTLVSALRVLNEWDWEEAGEHSINASIEYIQHRARQLENEIRLEAELEEGE